MTALAVFAFSQRSQARDQARSARSGQLVASALSVLDSDPELGIELSLEAARIEPTARAENALRLALDGSRVRAVIPTGHPVVGMDVDPARPRVLAVGDDGVARLYRLDTRRAVVVASPVDGWGGRVRSRAAGRLSSSPARAWSRSTRRPAGRAVTPVPVRLPVSSSELVPSPDGRSAIVLTGKPRARVDCALDRGVAGPCQASARRHRCRVLAGRPTRRVGGARPSRARLEHDGPGSEVMEPTAAGTTVRCSPSHSTAAGQRIAHGEHRPDGPCVARPRRTAVHHAVRPHRRT